MRLTEKGSRQCAVRKVGFEEEYKKNKKQCEIYNKLADLEDIEEELGIDLITFFKMIKSDEIVELSGTLKTGMFIYHKAKYLSIDVRKKCVRDCGFKKPFKFKDYGKTWALTKDELK